MIYSVRRPNVRLVVIAFVAIYVIHKGFIFIGSPISRDGRDVAADAGHEKVVARITQGMPTNQKKPYNPNGPGEMNRPVKIDVDALTMEEKVKYDEGWRCGYNLYAGDQVSVHRRLPDFREPGCFEYTYHPTSSFPSTSIIVIFNNEEWSTLLRTVHSCRDTAPPGVIKDIVLVDDCSDLEHLKQPLDDYMATLGNVKVIHTEKRVGSIVGRNEGAKAATGEVLMYLDSHCECSEGWLEPLLDRLVGNRTNVVMPPIDVIDKDDFTFIPSMSEHLALGGFHWALIYSSQVRSKYETPKNRSTDPMRTPMQPGGLYAIHKSFFKELGYLDPGLETWGADNIELSLKIWMCGGTLEMVPCSHIGHIYKGWNRIKWANESRSLYYNLARVAEVWLDDYKQYFYDTLQNPNVGFGDISEQVAIRKRLKCKSFDWFLKNVYPDKFIPGEAIAKGTIKNVKRHMCLDSNKEYVDISVCDEDKIRMRPAHSQFWHLSKNGEVRRDGRCMDYAHDFPGIKINQCHGAFGHQAMTYRQNGQLYHAPTNKCVAVAETGNDVIMVPCEENNLQFWNWQRT